MEALNALALKKARESIAARFSDVSSLDDIATYRTTIQKNLAGADSKLNVAVQGKLDALKRAVDLMDESSGKLNEFTNTMAVVNDRILMTCTGISSYVKLSKAHHARENIKKVIQQVDFFIKVPERIDYLNHQLEVEPYNMKAVFTEAISQQALREALLSEISKNQHSEQHHHQHQHQHQQGNNNRRRLSAGGHGHGHGHDESNGGGSMTAEERQQHDHEYAVMKRAVEKHLSIVPLLLKSIEDKLWDNLDNIWTLCAENPADIVSTFEIIAMWDEYCNRKGRAIRLKALEIGKEGEAVEKMVRKCVVGTYKCKSMDEMKNYTIRYDHILDEARHRLQTKLDEKVESAFQAMKNTAKNTRNGNGNDEEEEEQEEEEEFNAKESKVVKTLEAASQILDLLQTFKSDIDHCVPPEYEAMEMFLSSLDSYLVPEIINLVDHSSVDGLGSLDVGDLIKLIDWMEYYVSEMVLIEQGDRDSTVEFINKAEDLLHEYLERIKKQVNEWFVNIKQQQTEVIGNTDGTLFTSKPEDMFNALHMQMAVAQEKLPREHLKDVVNACLAVLRDEQRTSYDILTDGWKNMDPVTLCAYINDSHRMKEKNDEFADKVLELIPQQEYYEMLTAQAEGVSQEFEHVASHGTIYLARCILEDLEEAVFNQLFNAEWENTYDTHPLASMITATVNDYQEDISSWLTPQYFDEFCCSVLSTAISHYLMSLRKQATDTYKFRSEMTAANGILEDKKQLYSFFSTLEGIPPEMLEEECEYIEALARIISSTHISGVEDDVKALYKKYHGDGLKLVIAAEQCNPSRNPQETLEGVELAIKIYTLGHSNPKAHKGSKVVYSTKCSDAYKDIDPIPFDINTPITRLSNVIAGGAAAMKDKPTARQRMTQGLTWGRKKSTTNFNQG